MVPRRKRPLSSVTAHEDRKLTAYFSLRRGPLSQCIDVRTTKSAQQTRQPISVLRVQRRRSHCGQPKSVSSHMATRAMAETIPAPHFFSCNKQLNDPLLSVGGPQREAAFRGQIKAGVANIFEEREPGAEPVARRVKDRAVCLREERDERVADPDQSEGDDGGALVFEAGVGDRALRVAQQHDGAVCGRGAGLVEDRRDDACARERRLRRVAARAGCCAPWTTKPKMMQEAMKPMMPTTPKTER